jgi:hypothetical protein
MQHHSFFPRNRVALLFALLSLILFVSWNFTPQYEWGNDDAYKQNCFVYQMFWTESIKELINFMKSPEMGQQAWVAILELLLLLHVFVMLSLIPAWKFWQSTVILRMIPAVMLTCAGLILIYFLWKNSERPPPHIITLLLIAANIYSTAFSLLCFKNEWTEPEHHQMDSV